jgi:phosphatidate phosphatase APP1
MRPWKRRLLNILRTIRMTLPRVWPFFGFSAHRPKNRRPLKIASYRGYATTDSIFLQGRILQDRFIISTEKDSLWKNFRNNLKRFLSQEVPKAHLIATVGQNKFDLITDSEGYFHLQAGLRQPIDSDQLPWYPVSLHLTKTPFQKVDVKARAEVVIPKKASFGIISDIDDTILETNVTSLLKLRMLYLTFMKNAFHRNAFQAVGAFYTALQKGNCKTCMNPVFYVSNSPWNLYDLLEEFLRLNFLPKGPILLRDFGIPAKKVPTHFQGHKKESIKNILITYPHLSFVLIGDSGERDTDIYLSLAEEFPGRIRTIYIRDVKSPRRAKKISKKIQRKAAIEVHLIKDYIEAAQHAASLDLMDIDQFNQIRKTRALV